MTFPSTGFWASGTRPGAFPGASTATQRASPTVRNPTRTTSPASRTGGRLSPRGGTSFRDTTLLPQALQKTASWATGAPQLEQKRAGLCDEVSVIGSTDRVDPCYGAGGEESS